MTPQTRKIAEETCLKLYGKIWKKRVWSQRNYEIIESALNDHASKIREEIIEECLKIIRFSVEETQKEHGSPNVYIDMVGEIATETIRSLIKPNKNWSDSKLRALGGN